MQEKIREYFQSLKPEQLGLSKSIEVSNIERIDDGESNVKYIVSANGRKFVMRINPDTKNKEKTRLEYSNLKKLEGKDIAPKAFLMDNSRSMFECDFMVLEYIEGESLDGRELTDDLVGGIAHIFIKLNLLDPGDFENTEIATMDDFIHELKLKTEYALEKRSKYQKDKAFDGMAMKTIEKLEKSMPEKKEASILRPMHADIISKNIIDHDGHLYLIDFENFGLMDPAIEMAYTFESFSEKPFTEGQRKLFIQEYQKAIDDPSLGERIETAIPFILFDEFIWEVEQYYRITEKHFHESFTEHKDPKIHVEHARKMFRKAVERGVINSETKELLDYRPFP